MKTFWLEGKQNCTTYFSFFLFLAHTQDHTHTNDANIIYILNLLWHFQSQYLLLYGLSLGLKKKKKKRNSLVGENATLTAFL